MSQRPNAPGKKPTGGRPAPKRLFSFDSLRRDKSTSTRNSSNSSDIEEPPNNGSTLRLVEKTIPEELEDPFAASPSWTEKQQVTSPMEAEGVLPEEKGRKKPATKPVALTLDADSAQNVLAASDDMAAPPPSPSKRRWETIRHHVLPVTGGAETPPRPSSPLDLPAVSSARPSTPRGYRFGQKRNIRQVVDEVRAVDDVRKFSEEIYRACWMVRFGEAPPPRAKPEREASQGTVGSGVHLPFMSSTSSLPMSSSASVVSLQMSHKPNGLRRPPSLQTLTNHGASSVAQIARALTSTTSSNRPRKLPHENQIWSALLVPFLGSHSITPEDVEIEQATSVETFRMILQTWKTQSNEDELERCLWCCKAASVPSPSRIRLVGTSLSSLLFPKDKPFFADTPALLQTLLHALISLYADLVGLPDTAPEIAHVSGYIATICGKGSDQLSKQSVEKEYGVRFGKEDHGDDVKAVVVSEIVVKCLELGHENRRRWVLRQLLEQYWPTPEPSLTLSPLLACIHWRKLKIFIASTLSLFSTSPEFSEMDGEIIIRLFRSRILPEVEAMRTDDAAEIQTQVVRLVFELLCVHERNEREYILMHFCDWYLNKKDWKDSIHSTLAQFIRTAEWPKILHMIPTVIDGLPDDVRLPMISYTMPLIYERLILGPPSFPSPRLTSFLVLISQTYPKVFYKPLFSCAAASKESTVVNQLLTLNAISHFVPDFWTRDPEMVSIALMSDTSTGQKSKPSGGVSTWGRARIGQSALLLEVIQRLSSIRNSKDMAQVVSAVKFVTALEARLGMMVVAKEQTTLIPESQRILFCDLFREIRLMVRSLKPAVWLPSVVSWFSQWQADGNTDDMSVFGAEEREDVATTVNKLLAVYTQAQDSLLSSSTKRSTLISSPPMNRPTLSQTTSEDKVKSLPAPFSEHLRILQSMSCMLRTPMLELLVSVSALLSVEDYAHLAPSLWHQCMDSKEARVIASTCFLVMQCAEKSSTEFTRILEDDFLSQDPSVRRQALLRFGTLSSWRYQMLAQEVILDRSHRRPFKLARPPILFVATDIGSSLFVYEEDDDEWKDSHGHILPLELRRRLSEIGWAQEDRHVDQKTQWIRTPMSLLPSLQLEKLDSNYADSLSAVESGSPNLSPEPSPTKPSSKGDTTLTRQDSTSGGRAGVRRRPVFVMTLISLFPRLALMLLDRDFGVASAALDLIVDFMRDDSTLLARTVFNLLTGDEPGLNMAITTLRAFLHARYVLPPAMAHHILNHLTGFLKSSMKHAVGTANPLQSYAYSMPIIANLVTQVSNLSMREIRRAKIDMFLVPTGSLWFPPTAPVGSQFPRLLRGQNNPFEPLPSQLVWITLIRSSQNKLFLSMLKRNPQDIKIIRKHVTRLVLPSLDGTDDDSLLTLMDMLPQHHATRRKTSNVTLNILSLTLARSYLLLICQIFQAMSRHLNDRNELAILMDGLSRILVNHGNDINIVAHSMIAFMTASTRFRRLFTSGGGYTLFMAAVIKVYVEAEDNPGIRAAIEYATNRFYALHEDSFVFQTFDVISNVVTIPNTDGPWIASGVYALFSTLRHSNPPSTHDAAGIQGMNKSQEKEALMMTMAEQVPQTFLASFKRGNKQEKAQIPLNAPIPEEYEGRRLSMDNLVRLFLTVIAHNTGIQRAENFLRVLRLLAPELYHASNSARTVLRDGILALANILLTKSGGKSKTSDAAQQAQASESISLETLSEGVSQAALQPTPQGATPSDFLAMRLDYLSLVVAYSKAGGLFHHHTSQRILEVVKAVLKDSRASTSQTSALTTDYAKSVLIRDPLPPVKQVNAILSDLAPIVSAYCSSVDFSGLYDIVAELAGNSIFATEPSFAELVVTQYCRYGLDACELAASENLLFSLALRGSLLKVITNAVSMVSVDVITEIDKRAPTRDLFAGIVLPFALTLKTTEEVTTASQYAEVWRRDAHSKAWVRLLTYVLNVCENVEEFKGSRKPSSTSDRRKSGDSDQAGSAAVMTFSMALQTLKVIIVRAQDDISSTMPGVWARMGAVLKSVLSEGNASFALKAPHEYSEPPSPSFSPRQSTFSPQPPLQFNFPSSVSMHQRRPLSPPRVIDYLTWSFIQWLWLRRNPLIIQMRIFVQERIATLAQDLAPGNTLSSASSPRSRRISSVFSKPRRGMMVPSATSSAASTPRNSMYLSSSMSFPLTADISSASLPPAKDTRQPGYARITSPNSASARDSQDSTGPRIVHLGPVNISTASRSPGGSRTQTHSLRSVAKEMVITSPSLIRATYRRIRLVQYLMGFRDLYRLATMVAHTERTIILNRR